MASTSRELVTIDLAKCAEVAAVLSSRGIPAAAEETVTFLGLAADALPNFYFLRSGVSSR